MLRRLTHTARLENKFQMRYESLNIENINAVGEFPTWYNLGLMEDEVKHRLVSELSPFMRIEQDYDKDANKILIRASIRVVKERQY